MGNKLSSIAVIGMWHLGSVYAASFAKLGYKVTCFDYDNELMENFRKGKTPIHEPHLDEYISKYKDNLSFSTSEDAISNKDYIFVTFDLPVDEQDKVQIELIDKIIVSLKKYCKAESVIVISSQVPLGTSRMVIEELESELSFKPRVMYFPENLRLGNAFDAFLNPERVILGSDYEAIMDQFIDDFPFFNDIEIIKMGLESAEMLKHALNSYLATCISFSSEICDLCELLGANAADVVKGLKSDKRVSEFAPLNPGLGFAGGTLGRDIQSLSNLSSKNNYEPKLLSAVYEVNQDRLPMLIEKIKRACPDLKGKNIGVLGVTYKPNTNTLRRSMSLGLVELLNDNQVNVRAYDPVISERVFGYDYLEVCTNMDRFFDGLDMVVLMTDWPEFKELNFKRFAERVKGHIVIDTKNCLDAEKITNTGFVYKGMGI